MIATLKTFVHRKLNGSQQTRPPRTRERGRKIAGHVSASERKRSRRAEFILAAAIVALGALWMPVSAPADPSEYAIESASAAASTTQAGGHPDFQVSLRLKTEAGGEDLPSATQNLYFQLPPGLLGNPNAVPKCTAAQLIGTDGSDPSNETGCPQASQVGITEVELFANNELLAAIFEPVYNMEPRPGQPASLGFFAYVLPVFIDAELRPERGYAVTAKVEGISSLVPILSASSTLWGTPADESHDEQRITPYEAFNNNGAPETPDGKRKSGLVPVPYMLNPVRCGVPQGIDITAIPYRLPSLEAKAFAPLTPNSGCGELDFEPSMAIVPTTSSAETGAGLDVDLSFPTEGLEHPHLYAGAAQKRTEVTLPEGVTVNPSQAVGLGVCSEADFARETFSSGPNEGCPETAKIGSVTARSPLLEETAEGSLFIAKPRENPFGTLIALYMVLKIPERGVIVKLAGKVESDPTTGQLVTTFGEPPYEIPQLPVESFKLHFREGARSPLVTPPACGAYTSTATFTAWSGQVVTTHPTFQITSGVGGGPCPTGGLPPFKPGLIAGTLNNRAGGFSPFYLRLHRSDGEQEFTRFSIKLPPGIAGILAGIPKCSDAAIEAAKGRSGAEELAAPSCPAASEVGRTLAGAGVGQVLAYAPGKVYLAGPFEGAPISIAAITAAKVGPFDLGTVVVRQGFKIDPRTAEVFLDPIGSDPIPHIIDGIVVHARDIRAYVDRPNFVFNPTSCERMSTASTVHGSGLDFASPADDNPVVVSTPFQAADCAALRFRPRLKLRLLGGTRRGAHPRLRAFLRMPKGNANIAHARVTLPSSAFLDQSHIRTVCTRKQFAVDQCPAGSRYGYAKAVTPVLDAPIEGPVYLRSSENKLPDLVAALRSREGIEIELVGRVDSLKGRIRNTFDVVPDAPVDTFTLTMQGGNKGLIINSRNLCHKAKRNRARAEFDAHNGRAKDWRPVVKASCGKKNKRKKAKRSSHRREGKQAGR